MRRSVPSAVILAAVALALVVGTISAAPPNIVVKPSALNGWAVVDSAAGGASAFIADGAAPAGTGALQLTTDNTNPAKYAWGYNFSVSPTLASVTELSYYTKRNAGPQEGAASYQLPVLLEGSLSLFTTLVFEPYWNMPGFPGVSQPIPAAWTSWDVDAGQFWASGTDVCTNGTIQNGAGGPPFYTLADIEAACPGTVVLGFGVKVGSFNPSYDVEVDLVSFNEQAYDFEPETACTTVCYVDAANGDDSFGGDTISSAKKTIQAAIDAVNANGQVRVLPGDYDETATGRFVNGTNGPHQFGLFFDAATPGITVMGVTGADVAITDATATEAKVTTNATNNFGASGIFVDADNITIQGLEIGGNSPSDNKTIEVDADNFTLQYSKTSVPGGGGSVYINDWSLAGDVVKAYHVLDNRFTDGTSVDISSGAGSTGPLSGREIKNNVFDLQYSVFSFDFPAISFNGSGTTVPWYANTVGGAVITGNDFSDGNQYIRSRGTVVDADFDWDGWFYGNDFQTAVMTGPDPGNGDLTGYTYACGSYSCPNTMRIGATIQGEVDHAAANDIVLVKAGTYVENVVVPVAKSGLDFRGANHGTAGTDTRDAESIIDGDEAGASFVINADDVTLDGFTVTGGANGLNAGVYTTPLIGGYHIQNNVISGNTIGVYANSGSASWIEDNLFDANNIPGPSGGAGIYSEGTQSLTVDGNTFTGHTENNPALFAATASPAHHDLAFTNNTLNNYYGVYVLATDGGTFTGNDITATDGATALAFASGNNDIDVNHNIIHDSARGIRVDDDGYGFGNNSNITVNRNNLAGNTDYGLGVVGGYSGTLDGTCNWWGSFSGPGPVAAGAGSKVTTNVEYSPWLQSSNLNGECDAHGSITIILETHPENSTVFSFTGTNGISPFTLYDDGTLSPNVKTLDVPDGQYTIKVKAKNKWALIGLSCNSQQNILKTKLRVTIDVHSGEDITCTFTESLRKPDAMIALAPGGPFVGDDIYSKKPLPTQTVTHSYASGQTQSFYVTFQNDGLHRDTYKVRAKLKGSLKYSVIVMNGNVEITTKVKAGTYRFALDPGATRTIEVRVTAGTLTGTEWRNVILTMRSRTASAAVDVVRAHNAAVAP